MGAPDRGPLVLTGDRRGQTLDQTVRAVYGRGVGPDTRCVPGADSGSPCCVLNTGTFHLVEPPARDFLRSGALTKGYAELVYPPVTLTGVMSSRLSSPKAESASSSPVPECRPELSVRLIMWACAPPPAQPT